MAEEGQQHPLKIYWIMWVSLFVLSGMSYATDFMNDGALRHFLIVLFMFMKAGVVLTNATNLLVRDHLFYISILVVFLYVSFSRHICFSVLL